MIIYYLRPALLASQGPVASENEDRRWVLERGGGGEGFDWGIIPQLGKKRLKLQS